MSELELKPIPNIINVDDIQEIIDTNKYLSQEIERLNNIINELEKWLKSEYERYLNDEENLVFSNVEAIDYGSVLNKLKELKGSDKE